MGAAEEREEREEYTYAPWSAHVPWHYVDDLPQRWDVPFTRPGTWTYVRPRSRMPPRNMELSPFAAEAHLASGLLPDLRPNPAHPDWVPTLKLWEYQSAELSGFAVW